jgi:hypothetical protein
MAAAYAELIGRNQFFGFGGLQPSELFSAAFYEIAHAIANEMRLIREELQRLTGAIKSSANRSGNSRAGNSRKSYQARAPFPPESGQPRGPKQQRNPRGGEPRSQWHLPKDTR